MRICQSEEWRYLELKIYGMMSLSAKEFQKFSVHFTNTVKGSSEWIKRTWIVPALFSLMHVIKDSYFSEDD